MSSTTESNSTSAEDNTVPDTIEVTISDTRTTPIPLFLKKLWKMVNDPAAEEIIGWNATGDGFVIYNQVNFVTELLPQYFKHNNLSSFIRQLNFYDFHKIANVDKHEMEFAHSCFLKDLPETLSFITRKVPNLKSKGNQGVTQENVTELLSGVKELRTKHNLIDGELKMLKQENAALWNEINSLRIKYSKQTKIINKLIHFLISYMHSHQNTFNKTNITVSRKLDHKHLRNTPQLLQIDYLKKPYEINLKSSNSKMPSTSKTVTVSAPNNVKSAKQVYLIQQPLKGGTQVKPQKIPSTKIKVEPLQKFIAEVSPHSYNAASLANYNVTSPQQDDTVSSFSKSPCPIEELVSEVNPDLEESSQYTVKFPTNDLKSKQKTPNLLKIDSSNSTNLTAAKGKGKKSVLKSLVVSQPDKKMSHIKRKSVDSDQSLKFVLKPKILKTTQLSPQKSHAVTPQACNITKLSKKPFKKPKITKQSTVKKQSSHITETFDNKDNLIPAPSPVKPELVLDDLISEIQRPNVAPNLANLLSNGDLGLQLETEPSENILQNENEPFLFEDLAPVDLLTTLSTNTDDVLDQTVIENTPEEIPASFPTNSEEECDDTSHLDSELDSYPDDMLSKLSTHMPQVSSPSKELLKCNIVENPKEHLGLYLDNTQLQLNNIQDLLNDLNSEELFDLWGCFNVDQSEDSLVSKNNLILDKEEQTDNES